MNYTTIIFDMDGVVIDSEKIWVSANTELLAEFGVKYEKAPIWHLINGKSPVDAMKIILDYYKVPANPIEFSEKRKQLVTSKYKTDLEFVEGFQNFHKKIIELGYKTCVATAADHKLINEVNKILDLKSYFGENIFSVEDVGFKSKPDPAVFLYAAKQLGSKPEECIVIEDSNNGIQAAKNSGMFALGITTTSSRELLIDADLIVDRFDEVIKCIKV